MDLVPRGNANRSTTLSISRSLFDQLPRFIEGRNVIALMDASSPAQHPDHPGFQLNDGSVLQSHQQFIHAATKSSKPTDIFSCLKGPFHANWKAGGCKVQFQKNRLQGTFSAPLKKSILPKETRVFQTLLVPEYKDTDVPGIFECKVRNCTVGTPQIKGIDFPKSYCAIIGGTTIKIMLATSAAIGNTLAVIDVKNTFQTSIAPEQYRFFVTLPPLYKEWLSETENFEFEPGKQYVCQMLNGNQGTKAASNIFYNLIVPILSKFGFHQFTVDHAFFVKIYEDGGRFFICLAMDDLLCSFPAYCHFNDLVAFYPCKLVEFLHF